MKNPYEIVIEVKSSFKKFIQYQSMSSTINDVDGFVQAEGKAEDVLLYGLLLYPRFRLVENAVVTEANYEEVNWTKWRKKLSPRKAARIINHVHVEDFLYRDNIDSNEKIEAVGKMFAFYWQMAVNQQFPEHNVKVEFNGDVIDIFQE